MKRMTCVTSPAHNRAAAVQFVAHFLSQAMGLDLHPIAVQTFNKIPTTPTRFEICAFMCVILRDFVLVIGMLLC